MPEDMGTAKPGKKPIFYNDCRSEMQRLSFSLHALCKLYCMDSVNIDVNEVLCIIYYKTDIFKVQQVVLCISCRY